MASEERRFDAGGPTLAETGETELLRRLRTLVPPPSSAALVIGTGDDAAVWRPPSGSDLALSQDAVVEGRDFRREWTSPRQLGRRALAVALSDLAGMGATPAWCLVTCCAPGSTQLEDVLEIQRGVGERAGATGCALAGGDVSAIDGPLVLDVSVGGLLPAGRSLQRDQGRAGDALLVTGVLGRAAAGLRLLRAGEAAAGAAGARWLDAQLDPVTRIAEGRRILDAGGRCGADLSDGLLADVERLAGASGLGAELWLDAIPVDGELRDTFGAGWIELALGGGEDFELLVAMAPAVAAALRAGWPADLAPLRQVGALRNGKGVRLLDAEGGAALTPPPVSSRHFA